MQKIQRWIWPKSSENWPAAWLWRYRFSSPGIFSGYIIHLPLGSSQAISSTSPQSKHRHCSSVNLYIWNCSDQFEKILTWMRLFIGDKLEKKKRIEKKLMKRFTILLLSPPPHKKRFLYILHETILFHLHTSGINQYQLVDWMTLWRAWLVI